MNKIEEELRVQQFENNLLFVVVIILFFAL